MKSIIISQFVILLLVTSLFNPFSAKIMALIYADKYDINTRVFYKQIKAESFFRCFVQSPKNAIGLGQVLYSTAVFMQPSIERWHLYIPWKNLNVSAKYMQYLKGRFKDNYSLALAAYNWGETNVYNLLKSKDITIDTNKNYTYLFVNVRETHAYLLKILGK